MTTLRLVQNQENQTENLDTTQVIKSPKKPREKCSGLYFYPKLGVWKASNVTLNMETRQATSYGWWLFLDQIGPYLVFNNYSYSSTTRKHQSKVWRFLQSNRISFVTIEAPKGLQDLKTAREHYWGLITKLDREIKNPKSRAMKNHERRLEIARYATLVRFVNELLCIQEEREVA